MSKVIVLAEKRKSRSEKAAKQKTSLLPSIPHIEENDTYIFSKKIDKFIDQCIPWFLVIAVSYFVAQMFRYILTK